MYEVWHSEIMKVVRSSVELTLICEYTHNQEEDGLSPDTVSLMGLNLVYLLDFSPSLQTFSLSCKIFSPSFKYPYILAQTFVICDSVTKSSTESLDVHRID